jgi:TonB family protein
MKILSNLLLLYFLGWESVFAQSTAAAGSMSTCGRPEYPSASIRLGEEGVVHLKFLVGTDGKVIESQVEKSSGFRRLDEAARQGLLKCQFKPEIIGGDPQQTWASMKYTWRLDLPTAPSVQPNSAEVDAERKKRQ